MDFLFPLMSIAMALILGAMSPGPSFICVAQNSIAKSRKHGLVTALGTGTGAAILGLLAVLGLQAFLLAVPSAYMLLKFMGGLYLLWLAYKILKHAKSPLNVEQTHTIQTHYWTTYRSGLLTQLSNPKTAIVMAGIFTALLPKNIPGYYYIAIPALCFMIDAGWYAFVSVILSSQKPRQVYLRSKKVFDRLAGGILGILGIKLIFGMK
ncbi:LysE family translocator [Acinetobacter populi]|uniref:Threonine transporter n=1 Tax=Acinetobacter populi TaxID=1582270 RepID=A0A1Z9YTM2_9GAMM|nr:LysE family translocator [Acinetobacter populi]OUY05547.1 threonine transporter [Acinetobacter populi]